MSDEHATASRTRVRPRVGVLGGGTVGAAFVRLLLRADVADVTAVLVRDPARSRDLGPRPPRVTSDPDEALAGADVVVELLGGIELPTELAGRAVESGARLVTANKAALAEAWAAWRPWLAAGRVGCEAAVMAGTPAIGPLSGALRGSRPIALHALLNGTCAYLLRRLEEGLDFDEALGEAVDLGYAEADPSLDIDGLDAAHKLTVLGRLAFDPDLDWGAVRAATRGIRGIDGSAVRAEMRRGRRVRLVASLWASPEGWRPAVRPVALRDDHPLVVAGAGRNALLFQGDAVGEVLLAGAGAGGATTASAVLADTLEALAGRPGPQPLGRAAPLPADASNGSDPLDAWA
jgi:homoserine dehydrogenase